MSAPMPVSPAPTIAAGTNPQDLTATPQSQTVLPGSTPSPTTASLNANITAIFTASDAPAAPTPMAPAMAPVVDDSSAATTAMWMQAGTFSSWHWTTTAAAVTGGVLGAFMLELN